MKGVPPSPWPWEQAGPFDPAKFGPPGTLWLFTGGDLLSAATHVPAADTWLKLALQAMHDKLCSGRPDDTLFGWLVPNGTDAPLDPFGVQMRWYHATVHGKIGSNEEVAHTFNLRTQPTPDVDQTAANAATLAGQIRDAWQAFLLQALPSSMPAVQNYLSGNLVYDEVRVAYLEQNVAGINAKGQHDPGKKPTYLVPTQYASFNPTTAKGTGATSADLPWEVAMCLSLNTNVRGRSFRGRSYLGPLQTGAMDPNGLFRAQISSGIAGAFGTKFIDAVNKTAGAQFQVISRTHLTGAPIQGVRVGVVPDSQRRRRRSQLEAYTQAWGQPVGAVVPS